MTRPFQSQAEAIAERVLPCTKNCLSFFGPEVGGPSHRYTCAAAYRPALVTTILAAWDAGRNAGLEQAAQRSDLYGGSPSDTFQRLTGEIRALITPNVAPERESEPHGGSAVLQSPRTPPKVGIGGVTLDTLRDEVVKAAEDWFDNKAAEDWFNNIDDAQWAIDRRLRNAITRYRAAGGE